MPGVYNLEHFLTFIIVLAIALSAVSISLTLWFREQYHHQASIWFATAIAGLGSILLEILIWRYAQAVKPLLSKMMTQAMFSFSDFFAFTGGMLITISLPRFAFMRTGGSKGYLWNLLLFAVPLLTFCFGLLFMLGVELKISTILLQALMFTTVLISAFILVSKSFGDQKKENISYFKNIGILSLLLLPFVFLEALGINIHFLINDLSITLFVIGISLISIFEVHKLFGQPTFLNNNEVSTYFFDHYKISNREQDVVKLVLKGDSNEGIGEKLFISEKTVENHLTSILRKTKLKNRRELFYLIHSSRD
jgi:DNA-binding CsgD family transcriptional regulator